MVARSRPRQTLGRQEERPLLSQREIECLTWIARGKSSWGVSIILGISQNTVNFHVKQAMRKLEAPNRVVAVVKAIQSGLIEP